MKIKFAVLLSRGNTERAQNTLKMKLQLPELEITEAGREDVFQKHIALFDLPEEYDGIVILEDDVQLCRNFAERCESLIAERPDKLISMFESALSRKPLCSEYRAGNRFAWNQCNYYPKRVCNMLSDPDMPPRFKEYYAKTGQPWNYPIDTYIAYVLGQNKEDYWMQVPFLVQHLPLKSNFAGRPLNRMSKYFIDDIGESNG